jgi:hypothetical protein
MLDQLRNGDVVVDRLSRSLRDVLTIMKRSAQARVRFRSLTEAIDTTSAGPHDDADDHRIVCRIRTNHAARTHEDWFQYRPREGRIGGRPRKPTRQQETEIALEDGRATFRWKNYARAGELATTTLRAEEFIRRFLLHVLPKGFVKIRHFGFLAHRCRRKNVVLCCKLIAASSTVLLDLARSPRHSDEPETDTVDRCPRCKVGSMRMLEILLPQANLVAASGAVQLDTS